MSDKDWWMMIGLFGWLVVCCGRNRAMQTIGVVVAIVAILLAVLGVAHASNECLPSIKEVRTAHEHQRVSVRWKEGCGYYAVERSHRHRKEVVQAEQRLRTSASGRLSPNDSRPRQAFPPPGADNQGRRLIEQLRPFETVFLREWR